MRIQTLLAFLLATAVFTAGCFGSSKSDDGGDEAGVPEPKGDLALGFQPPDRDDDEGPDDQGAGSGSGDGGTGDGDGEDGDDGSEGSDDEDATEPGFFQSLLLNPWDITGHGIETEVGAEGFIFEAGIKEWRPQPGKNTADLPEPVVSRYCVLLEKSASNQIDVMEPSLAGEEETIRSWYLDLDNYKGYTQVMGDDFNPNTPEAWTYYNEGDVESYHNVSVSKFKVALVPHDEDVLCDKDPFTNASMEANIWVPAGHGASDDFWPVVHLDFETDDDHRGVWEYHAPNEVQPPVVDPGSVDDDAGQQVQDAENTAGGVVEDPDGAVGEILTPDQWDGGHGNVKLPYMAGDSFLAEPEAHMVLLLFGLDIVVEGWSPSDDVDPAQTIAPQMNEIGTDNVEPWLRESSNQYLGDGKLSRKMHQIMDGVWGDDEESDDGNIERVPILGWQVGDIPQFDAQEISDDYTFKIPANPATGDEETLVSQSYTVELSQGVPLPLRVTLGVKHHMTDSGQNAFGDDDPEVKAGDMARVQPSVYTDHAMLSLEMVGVVDSLNEVIPTVPGDMPDPEAFLEDSSGFVAQACANAGSYAEQCQQALADT